MQLLLQVQGDGWSLEIVGKLPELPPFLSLSPQTIITLEGSGSVEIFDRSKQTMRSVSADSVLEPIFFESVNYDIHFEKTNPLATLTLPLGSETRRVKMHNEHHTLNFGNNVGFSSIAIQTGTTQSKLNFEVFSRKADFRTDYLAMRDEVSGMLRNLAMAANARTHGLAAPAKDHNPTLIEWFALIESYFSDFLKLAGAIAKKPHSGLVKKNNNTITEKARRVSRQAISRSLRRENGGALVAELGVALPRRIGESISSSTFNTPENRYFKALIKETYKNIRLLSRVSSSGDEDANHKSEERFFYSIRPRLRAMENKLDLILRSSFLREIQDSNLMRPDSMVLHKHPLYSRFDKLCRLLNGGLSLTGNIVPIGIKETSLLYEYWCFLKIVFLLRNRFDLAEQNVVSFKKLRMTVALKKGRQSALKFIHKPTGTEMFLVYNRLFTKLPTLAQQPDNVIQFASAEKFYIFDAKYRIQFDKDYVSLYGGPGPTTDDINTMHRYRDAIAIPHPMKEDKWQKGSVIGAVTLFPYPNETDYRSHKFFNSINHVEIGGLPFLPNATSLVAEKIESILDTQYPNLSDHKEK